MFDLSYKKNKNSVLFSEFEKENLTNLKHPQNYIPLYNTFFSLNETNWNSINLNNSKHIQNIYSRETDSENTFTIKANNKLLKSFFKFSPLIDPVKYMYGKYSNNTDEQIYTLPTLDDVKNNDLNHVQERMLRKNNVSYVDGFFSYLSSKLKDSHGFINGQEYYGSFLGIKNNFKFNIFEDIEYLSDSNYFFENSGKIFTIDEEYQELFKSQSRKNKLPLNIDESAEIETLDHVQHIDTIDPSINDIFVCENPSTNIIDLQDVDISDNELVFEFNLPEHKELDNNSGKDCDTSSSSNCSSRTSATSHNSGNENSESVNTGSESGSDTDSDTYSTLSDDVINATIKKIPVQVICQEKLVETLDDYMNGCDVCDDEWVCIFSQIIFSLLLYQKVFDFTHNDLHTNNIMYNETNEEFVFYKYKKEYYKVRTFGKIWKIIDFGRAIYTFKGKLIVSDSYHKNEDAGTQFNFGEYYNKDKPLVKPNQAFDLCRLGCSLFDFFFDSIKDTKDCEDNLSKLIKEWCEDDNKKNILYKDNDKERYPGFKLYKMITRSVTKHTPENQLKNPLFSRLKSSRRHLKKSSVVVDIDKIPSYV